MHFATETAGTVLSCIFLSSSSSSSSSSPSSVHLCFAHLPMFLLYIRFSYFPILPPFLFHYSFLPSFFSYSFLSTFITTSLFSLALSSYISILFLLSGLSILFTLWLLFVLPPTLPYIPSSLLPISPSSLVFYINYAYLRSPFSLQGGRHFVTDESLRLHTYKAQTLADTVFILT
jgi:hypothetical protein